MKGNDDMTRQKRMERELLLLRYIDAISRGDLDTIGTILQQAEQDPELERGIWETHLALGEELLHEEAQAISSHLERDALQVRDLAASHFSASVSPTFAEAVPPPTHDVTVGELAAALSASKDIDPDIRMRLRFLEHNNDPCNTDLSVRGVRALLTRMGLEVVGKRLVENVQDLLFTLGMQRQGPEVRLAAARRQKSLRGLDTASAPESESEETS